MRRSQPISWCRPCSSAKFAVAHLRDCRQPGRLDSVSSLAARRHAWWSCGSEWWSRHRASPPRQTAAPRPRCWASSGRSAPAPASEPTSASNSSPRFIVSQVRIRGLVEPARLPAAFDLGMNGNRRHRLHRAGKAQVLAEAEHRLHSGIGVREQNRRAPAVRGCRMACLPRWPRSARRSRQMCLPGRSPSGAPSAWAGRRSRRKPPPAARLQASAAADGWPPSAASTPSRPFAHCAARGSAGSHCITSYSVFSVRLTTVLVRTRTFSRSEGRNDVPIALTA